LEILQPSLFYILSIPLNSARHKRKFLYQYQ